MTNEPSASEIQNAPMLELPHLASINDNGTFLTVQDAGSVYVPNAGGLDVIYYIRDMSGQLYRVPRTARVIQAWIRDIGCRISDVKYEFGILPNGNDYAEWL